MLDRLPEPALDVVCSFLGTADLVALSSTCWRLHDVLRWPRVELAGGSCLDERALAAVTARRVKSIEAVVCTPNQAALLPLRLLGTSTCLRAIRVRKCHAASCAISVFDLAALARLPSLQDLSLSGFEILVRDGSPHDQQPHRLPSYQLQPDEVARLHDLSEAFVAASARLQVVDLSSGALCDPSVTAAILLGLATSPTALRSLHVSHNDMGTKAMKFVVQILDRAPNLKHLSLSENRFGDAALEELAPAVCRHGRLSALTLDSNSFSTDCLARFCRLLVRTDSRERSLRHLSLLQTEGLTRAVSDAVMAMPFLESLHLGFWRDPEEPPAAAESPLDLHSAAQLPLAQPLGQLHNIYIVRSSFNDRDAEALARRMRAAPHQLSCLTLPANEIGDAGATYLAEAMAAAESHSIAHIMLGENRLTAMSCPSFASLLRASTALTSLNLSYNPLTAAGVAALAKGLVGNRILRDLRLCSTGMADEGLQALGNAMAAQPNMSSDAQVDGGGQGEDGKACVCESPCPIVHLDVSHNSISSEGVRAFAASVLSGQLMGKGKGGRCICSLRFLDLSYNQLDNRAAAALATAAHWVAHVNLDHNRLTRRGACDLVTALQAAGSKASSGADSDSAPPASNSSDGLTLSLLANPVSEKLRRRLETRIRALAREGKRVLI